MKRLWLVFLLLLLIAAFSTSTFAADVRFSGEFYAAGMYQDKTSFKKGVGTDQGSPSTAFYYQRLRVRTDFILSPGLSLVTRFDAMERAWGAARSMPGNSLDSQSAGTRAENENIAFDLAYVEYISPVGMFRVGYQNDGVFGTTFGDTSIPHGLINWVAKVGGFIPFIQVVKSTEKSKTAIYPSTAADNDTNKIQGGLVYVWKDGEAGLCAVYYREASGRAITPAGELLGNVYVLQPYAKVDVGPVKIQAEVNYAFGDVKSDMPGGPQIRVDNLIGWIDATADLKRFYVGGSAAYVAGNDWSKSDVIKGGLLTGGMDWNPTLLLFNNDRNYWAGAIAGNNMTSTSMNFISQQFGLNDTGMYNAWFFQGRVGVRPIDKLDIMASVSYALADSKTLPGGAPDAVSNVYGTEVDLVGTYKITNNLNYMLGIGYLFTGDYFKGYDQTASVRDNFIVTNKLTLTF